MSEPLQASQVAPADRARPLRRAPSGTGSVAMVLWQLALGIARSAGLAGRVGAADRQLLHLQSDRRRRRGFIAGSPTARSSQHIAATVYATAMGFLIGSVGGAILGVWLGVSPFASRLLNPYLNALNALPKVALAPLFVLWFGLGIESKIALAAVLVLFLVFLNTFAGVREVDQDLIDGARLMRATRTQVILKVIIPSAMSWVFAGLKIAMPYALIGAVLGEMIAANRGLGYLVQFSGSQFDTAGVFAVLFVIALLAVGLNYLVEMVQGRMERWRIVSR